MRGPTVTLPQMVSGKLAIGAGIAGLVMLLAVAAWGSTMLIQRNLARAEAVALKSKLATEQNKVRDWSERFGTLQALVDEQSRGINALFDAQQAADRKHAADVAAARKEAQPVKDRARVIATFKPPPGKDPAEETRAYIDQLLREERRR